jgi:hypothetical protein
VPARSKAWTVFLVRTLGSWVRIPLEAWMSVCDFSMCVFFCVGSDLATGWSLVQGVLPIVQETEKAAKGCNSIDKWIDLILSGVFIYSPGLKKNCTSKCWLFIILCVKHLLGYFVPCVGNLSQDISVVWPFWLSSCRSFLMMAWRSTSLSDDNAASQIFLDTVYLRVYRLPSVNAITGAVLIHINRLESWIPIFKNDAVDTEIHSQFHLKYFIISEYWVIHIPRPSNSNCLNVMVQILTVFSLRETATVSNPICSFSFI